MRRESQRIGRREALCILGAGALAARASAAIPSDAFTDLDHIEIAVPDAAKSAAFYARVFGGPIWKNNKTPRRYVKLGASYLAIEQVSPPFGVDQFAAGIAGFEIGNIHTYLTQQGIAYRDYPSAQDLNVSDPDGIRLQLSADNMWIQLEGATAFPEPGTNEGRPIFQPTGLDHILLNVTDPEKSAAFYEKIFGPVSQRSNNRIWFQVGISRVGLLKAPAGQRPGVNHFCVAVAAFSYEAATKGLEAIHAKMGSPEVRNAPEFRDPSGLLVQVMQRATG